MLAGTTLWIAGNRTIRDIQTHRVYSLSVVIATIFAAIVLYFIADIVGIAREGSHLLLGTYYQVGWVAGFGLLGLGWLRVHRDHYPLFFGLLGSAILLITLPYLYERISIFATIAPCLIWCGLVKKEEQHDYLLLAICCLSVMSAAIYEIYGSL
ncbi:hypothetical protein [Spirosoma sp. KNUC1025]|uniref:hypothetical protein n=1 Tax=Spirosoma sp. KNUC1025 TaxID=2894082 RepID=UPI00386F2D4C|nr:hypothetical protein LN737_14975 [Spirosoma sp. KNUC1025]